MNPKRCSLSDKYLGVVVLLKDWSNAKERMQNLYLLDKLDEYEGN